MLKFIIILLAVAAVDISERSYTESLLKNKYSCTPKKKKWTTQSHQDFSVKSDQYRYATGTYFTIGALNIGSEAASVCAKKTEYTHHTLFFCPFSSDITIKMVRFDVCFSWPFISFGYHKNNQVCFRFCSSCTSIFYFFIISLCFWVQLIVCYTFTQTFWMKSNNTNIYNS